MRRTVLAVVSLGLLVPGAAHAATLTLRADPALARFGDTVVFSGSLAPAEAGVPVGLLVRDGSTWRPVASGATQADGTFRLPARAGTPGSYVARATAAGTQVSSPPVDVRVRPLLTARLVGRRALGERLVLAGRLQPAGAGRLVLRSAGRKRAVAVDAAGRFRVALPAPLPGVVRWSLALAPRAGYERVARTGGFLLRGPTLSLGSTGGAVRLLEARLHKLRYALRAVDGHYGHDTYEAVLAFQKVHGLSRTGRVDAGIWARLERARVPRAFSPAGDHIEVSKRRQVMFEVRRGRVVKVLHVSTGATGNTPVGRWHVYLLTPGTLPSGMYYSLFFLRGFAIHGYPSVPPYPASHGCVRTPMWFAPGFYRRWGRIGTEILVFP